MKSMRFAYVFDKSPCIYLLSANVLQLPKLNLIINLNLNGINKYVNKNKILFKSENI